MADELESVRKALRELSKTVKSLPGDLTPRRVHKLRTATRRVEAIAAALPNGDGKKSRHLLKSIEAVRKAAGGVRDMDVLSANARKLARYGAGESLSRLLDHLKFARQQHATELQSALEHKRRAIRESLREYSKLVKAALAPSGPDANGQPGQSFEGLHASAMNRVRELGEWPPLDASNIHAFRLKVKELRYTLQLDADANPVLIDALTDVQRRIGDWHDWQELLEIARGVLNAEQDAALLARIEQTAKRRFERALSAANDLRGKYLAAPLADGA
jgi:CHAD domain-containing protein